MRIKPFLFLLILLLSTLGCSPNPKHKPFPFDTSKDPWGIEGKVAFGTSRGNDPYGVAVYQGGQTRKLTKNGGHPRWSPEGDRLLIFIGGGIGIVDPETGLTERIKTPVDDMQRDWLPGGKRILITGFDRAIGQLKSPHNVFLYDIETKEWKQLTHYEGHSGTTGFAVFNDGKRILCDYTSDLSWKSKERGTYIMDLETGEMKKIADWSGRYALLPDETGFLVEKSIWKGEKLISSGEIFFVDFKTMKQIQLTDDKLWKTGMTVSPDGKRVLYSAFYGDTERIFMLDIATKKTAEVFDRIPAYAGKVPHDRSPDWHA